jgi:hypothetical protein
MVTAVKMVTGGDSGSGVVALVLVGVTVSGGDSDDSVDSGDVVTMWCGDNSNSGDSGDSGYSGDSGDSDDSGCGDSLRLLKFVNSPHATSFLHKLPKDGFYDSRGFEFQHPIVSNRNVKFQTQPI